MTNVLFTSYAFPSTNCTTSRTQPDRNAQYIMLEDFGGVGDSATDNVTAFNAAVAALSNSGTDPITLRLDPSKAYAFNSSIALPFYWNIDGQLGAIGQPLPGYTSWNSASAKAVNYVRFTKNPANGESITLNGTVVQFVTGSPSGNQVQIAANMNTTVANLATALNASADAQISKCTYTSGNWLSTQLQTGGVTMAVLGITFDTVGTSGNSYTLVTTSLSTPNMQCGGAATAAGGQTNQAGATNSTTLKFGGLPTQGGTIILNSGAQILYRRNTCIRNCIIYNGDVPANYAGPTEALANIASFSGTAIAVDSGFSTSAPQCQFRNSAIIGFDTALSGTHFSRGIIEDLLVDAVNGIDISLTFDIFQIRSVWANTFYTANYNAWLLLVDTTYRMGALIHVYDGGSSGLIDYCFSYGHAIKYLCGNEFDLHFTDCQADGPGNSTVTPALLDFTITAGGTGYGANSTTSATTTTATLTPSKGEQLFVTVLGTSVKGISVIDPGTWNGTEALPTVTITGAGTGATATASSFVKAMGFSTYGNTIGRYAFTAPGTTVQSYGMQLNSTGGTNTVVGLSWASGGSPGIEIYTGGNSTCWVSGNSTSQTGSSGMFVGHEGTQKYMGIFRGSGSPEGVITADIASMYLRTDLGGTGTTLYVKQSGTGATGWVGK